MSEAIQAYCFKCKTQRVMVSPQPVFLSNGSPATQGTCSVCGSKLTKMGSTAAHAGMQKPEVTAKPRAAARKPAKAAKKTGRRASSKAASGKSAASRATSSKGKSARKVSANGASAKPLTNVGKLVIVESPAKARSVGQYLGKGYTVKASKGHVRDLLVSQLSVDVENDFEPKYRVMNDKRDVVKDLQRAVEGAREVYLATDPDREGEAIAWHLIAATEMDGSKPIHRVVFHEITKPAVEEAFSHPRDINMSLVNAQQARRILDRLVGYNVTELLWSKVRNRLSAGRVQSIAVRIIVDREREIEAFVSEEYWTLDASLAKKSANGAGAKPFLARLEQIAGQDVRFGSEGEVTPHLDVLRQSRYIVSDVRHGERQRRPSAPFTTSTLQQEASRRLGFNARRTMSIAQQLYEGIDLGREGSTGLITYMRTDSLSVSPQAQKEARDYVRSRFGASFLPARAPVYKTRTKGAQEAHEAIRPTSILREPEKIKSLLTAEQFKLYNLIWQRFVASQMANAVYNTLRVEIGAGTSDDRPYLFRVSGSTIKFAGFLALYEDARDEDTALDEDDGRILPELNVGEALNLIELLPEQHFTQPPPRYTEASLVRTLEEYGIGRPSTYAPTVAVIQDREYVVKTKDKRLMPTETGRIVNDLLVSNFPEVMDYRFTARMEDQLDTIAEGKMDWRPMLAEFYFPFERQLKRAKEVLPSLQQEEPIGRACPNCGGQLVIKYGRFGKFVGCSNYPTCRHTEPLFERIDVPCPTCGKEHGGEIIVRRTRKGKIFFGCSRYPECDYTSWKKPLAPPCPHCGGQLVEKSRFTATCTNCGRTTRISQLADAAEPA